MTTQNVSREKKAGLHLIAGPGACRTISGTLGLLLALDWFGYRQYSTVGGISGGSIPMSFLADGRTIRQIVDLAMKLEFANLLDEDERLTAVMLEHYWQSRYRGALPLRGKYHMKRFAAWLEGEFGSHWPNSVPYWTMATDETGAQVLVTIDGVFRRQEGGSFVKISATAPPVGTALCASCTIPGFFVPAKLELDSGEVLTLYDGALSWEGVRPLSVVEEYYGASPEDIIMFDVGPELNRYDRLFTAAWAYLCGGRCVPPRGKDSSKPRRHVLVLPAVTELRSFDFAAHPDKKWTAIMECFAATVYALNDAYRLTQDQFLEARDLLSAYDGFGRQWHKLSVGELSKRTESLLVEKGVLSS